MFGRATSVLKDHGALTTDFDLLRSVALHLTEVRSPPAVDALAVLEAFATAARNQPSSPVFGPELKRFVDLFQAHERAENAVLQEFFVRDGGGSG
jgi:hypothetical protein